MVDKEINELKLFINISLPFFEFWKCHVQKIKFLKKRGKRLLFNLIEIINQIISTKKPIFRKYAFRKSIPSPNPFLECQCFMNCNVHETCKNGFGHGDNLRNT